MAKLKWILCRLKISLQSLNGHMIKVDWVPQGLRAYATGFRQVSPKQFVSPNYLHASTFLVLGLNWECVSSPLLQLWFLSPAQIGCKGQMKNFNGSLFESLALNIKDSVSQNLLIRMTINLNDWTLVGVVSTLLLSFAESSKFTFTQDRSEFFEGPSSALEPQNINVICME